MISIWRFKSARIIFTNGCFDLLHKGHLKLLNEAASLGDRLVIGLNSDESVRNIKGEGRPYTDEDTRVMLLASFSYVDAVTVFNEETPLELIKLIKPDVIVKGGDYTIEEVVGGDIVISNGGEVKIIDLVEGYSSTNIAEKLKA